MSSITLTQAIARVRSRADMVNSTFIDDTTEVAPWLNEAFAELHDLVVSVYEDQFTVVSSNIVVSSGSTISLGAETAWCPATAPFYKLRGVDYLASGTADWHRLRLFSFNDRNSRTTGYSWRRARDLRYRIVGSSIHLTPDDAATGTYRIWYIPGFVDLANGSDTVSYPENWHEYAIVSAAAKALLKEESDARWLIDAKNALRARILAGAANRDVGSRMRIEDVSSRYDDYED